MAKKTAEDLQLEYGLNDSQMESLREVLGPDALRKTLAEQGEELKELRPLKDQVRRLEAGPAREKSLKDATGFDPEGLPPAAKKDLADRKFAGDEPTKEELSQFLSDYGLKAPDTTAAGGEEGKTPPTAAAVTEHANNAATGAEAAGAIKPEDVGKWSYEDQVRFKKEHPQEWESILQGKEVNVPFTPAG